MYFVLLTDTAIPIMKTMAEQDTVMSSLLEFGVLVGAGPAGPIKMLEGVLR